MFRWTIPFITLFVLILILSTRLLSDPDLGFHLKTGKWIIENQSVPTHDISTYTVSSNDYIDVHWFFQVIIYLIYKISGYNGLSILVAALSLNLLWLTLLRFRLFRGSYFVMCLLVLIGYLIIEPRIILRPEMFTFLYISSIILILELYYHRKKNMLYIIPVIMLVWVNTQGLFMLGFILLGTYFISILFEQKKTDLKLAFWVIISVFICFCNPYFVKGFFFPFELLTRFDSDNLFNRHIREFIPFHQLKTFNFRELLFIIFTFLTFLITIITFKKRKIHEFMLLGFFLYLSLIAVRNIPLFIIIAMPVAGSGFSEIIDIILRRPGFRLRSSNPLIRTLIIASISIFILGLSARVFTNAYYRSVNSPAKTGLGIDPEEQPVAAASFLLSHNLNGRIINSLGFGGWLSWTIPQPIFIDARLEVIKEGLYKEVNESWSGGLRQLINKYKPEIIIYNYRVYYPWTDQLVNFPDWHLVFVDGLSAVYVHEGNKSSSSLSPDESITNYSINKALSDHEIMTILNIRPASKFQRWFKGFYKKTDYSVDQLSNIGSFYLQIKDYLTAEKFFIRSLLKSDGSEISLFYALVDIYQQKKEWDKLRICYEQILFNDPSNENASSGLRYISNMLSQEETGDSLSGKIREARSYFNSGNKKYLTGNLNDAVSDFTMAIRLNPNYYKAYNNRGIILAFSMKKYLDARNDFESAILLNPSYADAYLGRGSVLFYLNDLEGACRDWQKSADLGNNRAQELLDKHCRIR